MHRLLGARRLCGVYLPLRLNPVLLLLVLLLVLRGCCRAIVLTRLTAACAWHALKCRFRYAGAWGQVARPCNCHSAASSQKASAISQQTYFTRKLAALAVMLTGRALGLQGSWVLSRLWPLYPRHRRFSPAVI